MPGIDVSAEVGRGWWSQADADGVARNVQRARLDGMILASRRALAGDIVTGNSELEQALAWQTVPLYGWICVTPADVDTSVEQIRKYASAKHMVGVRLDTTSAGQPLHSDASLEILNSFRRFGKPALVTVRNELDVAGLEALAKQVTSIKFIAGGAGGQAWQACAAVAKRTVNVMLEPFTSGCESGKVEAMAKILGAHRLLFATGYPDQNPGAALGLLADAKLTEGEKQAILNSNAVRLFGLG